jgi:hypothetical protein
VIVAPVDAALPPSRTRSQHVVDALPPLITVGGFILLKPEGPVVYTYVHVSAELHP